MKNRSPLRPFALIAAALAPLAFVLLPPASRAESPPAASASASASDPAGASAGASASASASASARSGPPLISDDPPPAEKSKPPTLKEWKDDSRPIAFDRPIPSGCVARRVREWVRMTCSTPAAMVAIVAGPSEGFSAGVSPIELRADPSSQDSWGGGVIADGTYHLQFPVRPGERRVFEITGISLAFQGTAAAEGVSYVVVSWLPDEAPVITMQ